MAPKNLHLYVAFGQRRGQDPLHWIILVVPDGSDRCTYYHVVGGPTQGNGYQLQIQANKRVNSNGISTSEYVGTIAPSDLNKLKASAQRVALQFCQSWVVQVLEDIERKGLIGHGTAANWHAKVEPDPYAQSASVLAESSTSSTVNWEWDEAEQKYRYWNGSQWIYQ